MKFQKGQICIAVGMAITAMPSVAASTWNGSNGSDYFNQANWSDDGNTATSGSRYILDGTANAALNSGNSESISFLQVGGSNHSATLDISNTNADGSLSVTDKNNEGNAVLIGVGDNAYGKVTLNQPGDISNYAPFSVDISGGSSIIGSGSGSYGELNILSSGKKTENQYMGGQAGWSQNYGGVIGENNGTGVVNVDGGSIAFGTMPSGGGSDPTLYLGSGTGGTGTINVLGGGKLAYNPYDMPGSAGGVILGNDGGIGVLNISGLSADGQEVSRGKISGSLIIGQGEGSSGAINITDNGSLVSSWSNDDGSQQTALGIKGGNGTVSVSGEQARWLVGGYVVGSPSNPNGNGILNVGASSDGGQTGIGSVTISNQGQLVVGSFYYSSFYDSNTGKSYQGVLNEDSIAPSGKIQLSNLTDTNTQGTLNIGGAEHASATAPGEVLADEVNFGSGNAAVVFNHTDTSGDYQFDKDFSYYLPDMSQGSIDYEQSDDNGISSNQIKLDKNTQTDHIKLVSSTEGKGTIKQLSGVTVLGQNQTAFTGETIINGGALVLRNGQLGGTATIQSNQSGVAYLAVDGNTAAFEGTVNIKNGNSILTGNGTVGSVISTNGGTISPGLSFGDDMGTLTIAGNYSANNARLL
ncbi:hypothetical protein, partial [Snodgrassella sp. CFCC 13594]|uniref:beta strand repeat-containing protein n=1 Tax=Snodgrassella sp. CFCC 13594 TaxID=1775559 RepID=UPI000A95E878